MKKKNGDDVTGGAAPYLDCNSHCFLWPVDWKICLLRVVWTDAVERRPPKSTCGFRFPINPKIRKNSVEQCYPKEKFDPSTRRMCSNHFSLEQFDDIEKLYLCDTNSVPEKFQSKLKLKLEAVPDSNFPTASVASHSELKNGPELPFSCSKSKFAK